MTKITNTYVSEKAKMFVLLLIMLFMSSLLLAIIFTFNGE